MVLGVHSFFSFWCWWVSSPHTSQVSLQLLLRDIQVLEVLDVNFCARICWVQRQGSVSAVERWSLLLTVIADQATLDQAECDICFYKYTFSVVPFH